MEKYPGKKNTAVFISGRGSNLKSLIKHSKKKNYLFKIILVVSNNVNAEGLKYASKSKIKSMRYETESCVLCEASASLLSSRIRNAKIQDLIREIEEIKKSKKNRTFKFSEKLKDFNKLINQKSFNRLDCVILPMEAFLKAFKTNK